jgi:hypothetical protein
MMDRKVDLRYVRDNLGHAPISTISQYLHADDDDRYRATESGLKLDWCSLPQLAIHQLVDSEFKRELLDKETYCSITPIIHAYKFNKSL